MILDGSLFYVTVTFSFLLVYKPIGAAPLRHLFFGEGGILVWFNAPRATDFREKRNPPQADSIVSVL